MKHYILILLSICSFSLMAQTSSPALKFDGIDDYIAVGTEAGNNIRTIELWFKPDSIIDSTNSLVQTLVARNTTSNNIDEFSLAFQPSSWSNSGTLRFTISEIMGSVYSVYSNDNVWEANKWYHVAGVVHQDHGMMLFINGVKQEDTLAYSKATETNSYPTMIGCWGDETDLPRFFKGTLDNIRFSEDAIYGDNFSPSCTDFDVESGSIGVWNLNDSTGAVATDSSANNYHGEIFGAVWKMDTICSKNSEVVAVQEFVSNEAIVVYPNPASDQIQINESGEFTLFNMNGAIVLSKTIKANETIHLDAFNKGMYFYSIKTNTSKQNSKLILQ